MRGVMAVRRRPQVELATQCLKCVDSSPGGISQGLMMGARGFSSFDSIIATFVKVESVVLTTNNKT